jgi:hypothetical protein
MRVAVLLLPPPSETMAMTDESSGVEDDGMALVPGAQITVWGEDGRVETSLVMTRDELARHVTDCRAVYDSMQAVADASRSRWDRYHQAMKKREERS